MQKYASCKTMLAALHIGTKLGRHAFRLVVFFFLRGREQRRANRDDSRHELQDPV